MIKDPTKGVMDDTGIYQHHKKCLKQIYQKARAYGTPAMMEVHRKAAAAQYDNNGYMDLKFIDRLASLLLAYASMSLDTVLNVERLYGLYALRCYEIDPSILTEQEIEKVKLNKDCFDNYYFDFKSDPDKYYRQIYKYLYNMPPKDALTALRIACEILKNDASFSCDISH